MREHGCSHFVALNALSVRVMNRQDVRGTEELPIVLDSDGEEIVIDSLPAVVHAKGSPLKLICTKRHR